MLNRQQKRAEFVQNLFKNNSMPRNQIASRAGLSNPYIMDLEAGNYRNVDRKKLISLSVGLSLSLNEADVLLNLFDRTNLTVDDIPLYIQLGKKSVTSSAMHPISSGYSYELSFLSLENTPGDLFIVAFQPSCILQVPGHHWYRKGKSEINHPIYGELIDAIGFERYQILNNHLENFRVEQFLCKRCLIDYMDKAYDRKEKEFRKAHIGRLIDIINTHDNFAFHLVHPCTRAHFTLKIARESGKPHDTVIFCFYPRFMDIDADDNYSSQYFGSYHEGSFSGFETSNGLVVRNYEKEVSNIRKTIIEEYEDRERLVAFLKTFL